MCGRKYSLLSYSSRLVSNGDYDRKDKPHRGRPVEVDGLAQYIEEDPRRPSRQLKKTWILLSYYRSTFESDG